MNAAVRMVGHRVEWSCPHCGCVLQGERGSAGQACGACGGLVARIADLHRALVASERETERLARLNDEQCDTIFVLRNGSGPGLSEQARQALALAKQYIAEGDDLATSERLRHAVLQAIACVASLAAEIDS